MDSLNRLEEIFAHFPGIGPRQAKRFVYHLQTRSPAAIKEFIDLVQDVRRSTIECARCSRFFLNKNNAARAGDGTICDICGDAGRDAGLLLITARDSDFETIEKSRAYRGYYFILGGTVPILDKEPERRIRLKRLLEQTALRAQSGQLREIILSLNATPDGEHTADVVRNALTVLLKDQPIKITVLGRGLSKGAELEYVDGDTIKSALENRH